MALFQGTFFAKSISRATTFNLVLPNDCPDNIGETNENFRRPVKTLFLLHGYCGNYTDWLINSPVQDLASRYNLAIVMPQGDNSFYLNGPSSCGKYEDFISKDLIEYLQKTFKLALDPKDTFIGGLSMGGFGALHNGLAHPEVFGKMFGLSSALIQDEVAKMEPGTGNPVANYDYYASAFGNPKDLPTSSNNPKAVAKKRVENKEKIQPVFMACGSEDFLIEPNRDFKAFLESLGIDVKYYETPGVHDWKFWNEYIEKAIMFCLE